jgi:chloride channel protein, CIC family
MSNKYGIKQIFIYPYKLHEKKYVGLTPIIMINNWINKLIIWRVKHLKEQYFVIILSAIIGLFAGFAAYLLKTSVFFIKNLLLGKSNIETLNVGYFLYPAIGIFLTILFFKFIIKDKVKHGIPRILYVISKKEGRMKRHKFFSSIFGASLTAGFGGSIGLESPVISTGSSFGSFLGHTFKLKQKTIFLLIGCGAAGAMASIFTTPVAAVIFSLEVLMLDLATTSIIPLLIASVSGAITTRVILSENILFNFSNTTAFNPADIPFYIILGVMAGLVSFYFNSANEFIRGKMEKIKNTYYRALIGVSLLGLLIFLFPPLYGEGYEVIKHIADGNIDILMDNSLFYSLKENVFFVLIFVLLLILFKIVATTLTTESGGIGGVFAPAAVTGGLLGFLFAKSANQIFPSLKLPEVNFMLVGMAGLLCGVLHAPLTSIFLIAEMTSGYQLIVPLMLTTTVSFITIKILDPHSIFTKRLAERGELLTHQKDQTVLTLLKLRKGIEKDVQTIKPHTTLGDLTEVISECNRNLFPVVDEREIFIGIVLLDSVRKDMFDKSKWNNSIEDYIFYPNDNERLRLTDSMELAMTKFKASGNYNLVVLDGEQYIGIVSRANIFNAYRQMLIDVTHE